MKKNNHNNEYLGRRESFYELEKTLKEVIDSDESLKIVYNDTIFKLQLSAMAKKLRKAEGLTQSQLAEKANVKQSFISRIENPAAAKKPSFDTLAKIATALGKEVKIEIV